MELFRYGRRLLPVIMLAIALALTACGGGSGSSSGSNTQDNTQDNSDATPNGSQQPGRDTVKLEMLAGRPGDTWYVLGHSLSTFLNEDSDWLQVTLQATGGLTDNSQLVLEQPGIRSHVLPIISNDPVTFGYWRDAGVDFGLIGNVVPFPYVIVTYDPNLRDLSDLQGKRVGVPRQAASPWPIFESILREAGVLDDVELIHGGIGPTVTAIQDGTVDAGVILGEWYYPDLWGPSPEMDELSARSTLHFVDMDPAVVERAFAQFDFPPMYIKAPAGSLGPGQDRPITVTPWPATLVATKDLDEDIVYEVTRILYERAQARAFVPYHAAGAGITEEWVVSSYYSDPAEREAAYHPGALRYYRENGIELLEFER